MLYPDFEELIRIGSASSRLRLGTKRRTLAAASGDYASPFRGQGLEFHEVREYRPGDDVRNIDWRVTARTNRPFMKVFTEERERTVLLCVDANAAMRFGTRGTFKSIQAARAAAVLGRMAQAAHDRIGAVVFGDVPGGLQHFAPARSRRALWQALKLLSLKPARGDSGSWSVPLETAVSHLDRVAPTGSLIFIVSDFYPVTDMLEKALGNLRRRCDVVLLPVTDPSDRQLPPLAPTWFGRGVGTVLTGTGSVSGRRAYEKQWRENRAKLEDIVAHGRMGMVDLRTDGDVSGDIARGLRGLDFKRSRR